MKKQKQDFTPLKKFLPEGYAKALAEKHKVSVDTIYKVVNGRRKNEKISEDLILLVKENKEKISNRNKVIKQLSK